MPSRANSPVHPDAIAISNLAAGAAFLGNDVPDRYLETFILILCEISDSKRGVGVYCQRAFCIARFWAKVATVSVGG